MTMGIVKEKKVKIGENNFVIRQFQAMDSLGNLFDIANMIRNSIGNDNLNDIFSKKEESESSFIKLIFMALSGIMRTNKDDFQKIALQLLAETRVRSEKGLKDIHSVNDFNNVFNTNPFDSLNLLKEVLSFNYGNFTDWIFDQLEGFKLENLKEIIIKAEGNNSVEEN